MKYEEKVKKLEQLVEKLGENKASLEDSLKMYEDGISLAKGCLSDLSEYKGKITVLNSELEELKIDTDD